MNVIVKCHRCVLPFKKTLGFLQVCLNILVPITFHMHIKRSFSNIFSFETCTRIRCFLVSIVAFFFFFYQKSSQTNLIIWKCYKLPISLGIYCLQMQIQFKQLNHRWLIVLRFVFCI